jgi:hypothetical protein
MKSKRILIGLFSLIFIIISSCKNDSVDTAANPKNAKLKRILGYSSIHSDKPFTIVEEYEYDKENRVSKVSSPAYQDGKITGIIKYDLYEYNSKGQLEKIANYNANINSPTGFMNLINYSFTYSSDGKKVKQTFEYPQIGSSEYLLYKYIDDRLVKIEKYGNTNQLESYVVNEYDNSGNLVKETSYGKDNLPYSYTRHLYENGQNIQSDVYAEKNMVHMREIFRTYDKNNNLIVLESNELSLFSSSMSYVLKYEYFTE